MSAYFTQHGLIRFTQVMMASITALLGIMPALMIFSPSGPRGPYAIPASIVVSCACGAMTACWLRRWPTRRQSIAFAVFANWCIAVALLVQSNSVGALIGSSAAFAVLCGYVGFFHSPRLMALSFLLAQGTTVAIATDVVRSGDPFLAIVAWLLVTIALLSIPFAIQAVLYVLGLDALRSHQDPLTGLLNRRAFYRGVQRTWGAHTSACGCRLAIMMVDLDDFKALNDTRGHAEGDRALVAAGDALRGATRDSAVIARVGGEEFLIADILSSHDIAVGARRITLAVAATPARITASVGVASMPVHDQATTQKHMLEKLVVAADAAMYVAKRSGGNQFRHHPIENWSVPTTTSAPR